MSAAIGTYEGTLRTIIHALKYDRHRSLARELSRAMAGCGCQVLEGAHAVVPVPLHWRRRWQRGFNQADLLAGGLGLPVWHALVRIRATRSQVDLPADARRSNVIDAFALAGRLPPRTARLLGVLGARYTACRWRQRMHGTIVVLVDDVTTTGATLEACARVVRRAGAREVRALTAARVPVLR